MFMVSIAHLKNQLSSTRKIKRIIMLPLIFLLGVSLYPFINGYGCDFKFETNTERFHIVGECQDGILSYVTLFKPTNMISTRKNLFGVVGHKVITIKLARDIYASPSPHNTSDLKEIFLEHKFTSDVFRFYYWGITAKSEQAPSDRNHQRWFFIQKVNNNIIPSQIFYFDVDSSSRLAYIEPR